MLRTSSGTPDHAEPRKSAKDIELAWSMRLNLLIREIRVECASATFALAFGGKGGWLIR